jgi:uncharacterized membrane protein YdfJ with MMPL/SSD domain
MQTRIARLSAAAILAVVAAIAILPPTALAQGKTPP